MLLTWYLPNQKIDILEKFMYCVNIDRYYGWNVGKTTWS